jgi:hypothetical protein
VTQGWIRRLWPSSLQSQMLLAVAIALFLAQGLGAVLVYRAQAERREAAILHGAAFRLLLGARSDNVPRVPRRDSFIDPGSRVLRLETGVANPIRPDEVRIPNAEQEIRRIMREQNREVDEVMVVNRRIGNDTFAQERLSRRTARGGGHSPAG